MFLFSFQQQATESTGDNQSINDNILTYQSTIPHVSDHTSLQLFITFPTYRPYLPTDLPPNNASEWKW